MEERDETNFLPKTRDFIVQIVTSNKQADELAAHAVDFRKHIGNAQRALDKEAVAFCIFIGKELAHVGWLALTEEAKDAFDPLPYRIDFSNKEACTGGTITFPKFRGKGLMTYGYFKRFQFLWENGIKISRNAVKTNNIISQKVHNKFNPKIYAKAYYVRFLWWKFLITRKV
ncbi:MAG: hypothetical protein LUQ20_01055 [Candidatus Methanoperedens sp.]|nr:hypothetical protein [Candidatus Methanoperedens sp.]